MGLLKPIWCMEFVVKDKYTTGQTRRVNSGSLKNPSWEFPVLGGDGELFWESLYWKFLSSPREVPAWVCVWVGGGGGGGGIGGILEKLIPKVPTSSIRSSSPR